MYLHSGAKSTPGICTQPEAGRQQRREGAGRVEGSMDRQAASGLPVMPWLLEPSTR